MVLTWPTRRAMSGPPRRRPWQNRTPAHSARTPWDSCKAACLITASPASARSPTASRGHAPRGCGTRLHHQSDNLKSRVEAAAAEYGSSLVIRWTSPRTRRSSLLRRAGQAWDGLDILVHSIATRRARHEAATSTASRARIPHRPRHLRVFAVGPGQGRAAVDAGRNGSILTLTTSRRTRAGQLQRDGRGQAALEASGVIWP